MNTDFQDDCRGLATILQGLLASGDFTYRVGEDHPQWVQDHDSRILAMVYAKDLWEEVRETAGRLAKEREPSSRE